MVLNILINLIKNFFNVEELNFFNLKEKLLIIFFGVLVLILLIQSIAVKLYFRCFKKAKVASAFPPWTFLKQKCMRDVDTPKSIRIIYKNNL